MIDSLELASDRLTTLAGDFFVDPLPDADAYLLMEVLHDWPDTEAAAILRAVRRAAAPGTTVLVIEDVVPEGQDGQASLGVHTVDVLMLALTGGRERTARELGEVLLGAGFRSSRVVETATTMRIVEAIAI